MQSSFHAHIRAHPQPSKPSALERQLDANSADPVIEHVFFPLELWRSDALESDFDYLAGDERDAICHREFGAAKRYAWERVMAALYSSTQTVEGETALLVGGESAQ